ncbi:hypothetical protein [Halorussus pelagicus]|uniref:hypothetical protein n=1 Tax=Halorussus pelagicus TaxID=2505977 RepID=UPI000FFB9CCB|nr:hypothetical protein [Halorussus pelagicus]
MPTPGDDATASTSRPRSRDTTSGSPCASPPPTWFAPPSYRHSAETSDSGASDSLGDEPQSLQERLARLGE